MSDCRVRLATESDLGVIVEIERECVGAPQWGEGVWRGMLVSGPVPRCAWVAEVDGGVAGFIAASCVGEVGEIESVAVRAARRRGIGRALCVAAMEWSRELRANVMELEVRASSAAAREMYGGLGFEEQGRRRGYYSGPVEDAVLMSVSLRAGRGDGMAKV